ncbi:PucR family transcriptional regulator [Clostridium sp. Marseille-P2415]|uniref:PucR family transcriptional regulator n=1 Tax=Clostridium sp. Marseille-P2415 TaxID=1805471 RepID=UPI0009882EDE|nr:PucR family transcriptional regulator [Clostridium sp. Marseille-P2415]
MKFTVEEFLRMEELGKMTLICGENGLKKEIKGATIIEAPDIVKFINGGELLLTGLYAFRSCTIEEFKNYISELQRKEVSGLILKRRRLVEDVESKIVLLKEYAEKCNVPLIEVPFEISFQTILSLVMERLFNEEVTKLKYYKTTHDNFMALSLSNSYKKNPVGDILDMLNKLIRNPIALYNQNMSCYASAGDEEIGFELSKNASEYDPGIFSNYKYMEQKGEYTQYIVRISLNVGVQMYLVIIEKEIRFNQMDCIAVENAIVALQYEFSRKFAVSKLEKKYQHDLLNNILNGKVTSADELKKNASLLGMNPNGYYRVIVFGVTYEGSPQKKMNERLRHINWLEEVVKQQLMDVKVLTDMDKVVAIKTVNPNRTQVEYRKELKEMWNKVQTGMSRHNKKFRVKAGVGKIVDGIMQLAVSYQEAADAFSFIDIAADILYEGNSYIMMFSDLGIFKLLCQMDDPAMLLEYVPESLQKLYNYKKPQQEDLVITLKTYLNYNQNLSKTAQDLYVHYKTAAYRIAKISKITGIDFDNANERLAVRIGLVVYKLIENYNKM